MQHMKILESLLGGAPRVKMMRLFLFNESTTFTIADIAKRVMEKESVVEKEIRAFQKVGFVKSKPVSLEIEKNVKRGVKKIYKKRTTGYSLDQSFVYVNEFGQLLLNTTLAKHSDILKKIIKVGKIKFIALAGIFIQNEESRLDIFIVGDSIKKNALESAIKSIESEVGKELKYTALDTADFHYRVSMYDKLVADVLDFPHEKILNRLGL